MRGADPSWEIMPVANPDLPAGKRRRMIRDSLAKDPVGTAKPQYQTRHRQRIVAPCSLDRACRQLLLRAQVAIDSVLDSALQQVELPDTVTEATLRRHEWEIAVALRDITELRTEHEYNEISGLAEQAAAAARAFQDTVQDVGLAAAELELPGTK